jgi:hypothetical protein
MHATVLMRCTMNVVEEWRTVLCNDGVTVSACRLLEGPYQLHATVLTRIEMCDECS